MIGPSGEGVEKEMHPEGVKSELDLRFFRCLALPGSMRLCASAYVHCTGTPKAIPLSQMRKRLKEELVFPRGMKSSRDYANIVVEQILRNEPDPVPTLQDPVPGPLIGEINGFSFGSNLGPLNSEEEGDKFIPIEDLHLISLIADIESRGVTIALDPLTRVIYFQAAEAAMPVDLALASIVSLASHYKYGLAPTQLLSAAKSLSREPAFKSVIQKGNPAGINRPDFLSHWDIIRDSAKNYIYGAAHFGAVV